MSKQGKAMSQCQHVCPHCGLTGKGARMLGSHFEHCKLLKHEGESCSLADKPAKWLSCVRFGCDYGCKDAGNMAKHVKQAHNKL